MSIKVALAGATGNLGPAILKALLEAGFEVTILSRKDSASTDSLPSHPKQKIVKVDYTDVKGLTLALSGIDTLVSNLATAQALDLQKPLIDASVAAGVRRFLPSEFGSDLENPQNQALPVYTGKVETRKYIESVAASNPSFTYTYIINIAFLDWGLQVGFIANVKNHTATLYDGGDGKFSVTTLPSVGKAVVGVINNQDATKNRSVYVQDSALSLKEIIELTKSIDGQEWSTDVKSTEEIVKASYEEFSKPNPDMMKAIYGFLFRAAFSKETEPDFSGKLDNKLLGITEFSQEQVKEVIKAYL